MDNRSEEKFYNRSLERALHILNTFNRQRKSLSLSQLAENLNLSRATVLRLCTTLIKYDFLAHDPETKRYSLGPRLFELGSIAYHAVPLREAAASHLSRLHQKVGKTIFLGILVNDQLLYIDKREDPGHAIRFTSQIGTRRPPHWGMLGPLLMAFQPDEEVRRLLEKNPLTANTKKSIVKKDKYLRWLKEIRDKEVALDLEGTFEGVTGVAVPVRDSKGTVIAALGVAFISAAVDPKGLKTIIKETKQTAQMISRDMGLSPDH
jgi:DNA-binding IclR family transcriptional regulator